MKKEYWCICCSCIRTFKEVQILNSDPKYEVKMKCEHCGHGIFALFSKEEYKKLVKASKN